MANAARPAPTPAVGTLLSAAHPAQAASCVECGQDIPCGPLCDGCGMVEMMGPHRYTVAYFDAKLSRAGKGGSRVRHFTLRSVAEEFASRNRYRAEPCTVKAVSP